MSRSKRAQQSWRSTRWARLFIAWCEDHPLPGTLALFVGAMVALFTLAQGVDWAVGRFWPPVPRILKVEEEGETGANFSITIENPTDTSMVVSDATFRTEPLQAEMNANYIELVIPAVTYDLPLNCSPGVKRVKLNPAFKITPKDVGAVVFRSTRPMGSCRLYVSLKTSQGDTKEQEGVSLARWRERGP